MRNRKILLLVVLTMVTVGVVSICHAGERYGPWKYYAPYYFPPDGCLGCCWSALDFLPKYETPPPARPSYDPGGMMCPTPRPVRKVARAASPNMQVDRPVKPRQIQPRSQFDNSTGLSAPPIVNRRPSSRLGGGSPVPIEHPGPQPRSLNRQAPTSRAY